MNPAPSGMFLEVRVEFKAGFINYMFFNLNKQKVSG